MTEHFLPVGSLAFSQTELDDSGWEMDGYDFIFSVAGWESRTNHAVLKGAQSTKKVHLLKFASASEIVRTRKEKFLSEIEDIGLVENIIELQESVAFDHNIEILSKYIEGHLEKYGKPISRIAINITCMPKHYIGFLIGFLLENNVAAMISLIYSEGDYEKIIRLEGSERRARKSNSLFSKGDWISLQVPYLGSELLAPDERDLLLALGAEISLSLSFAERYEPSKLGAIIISDTQIDLERALSKREATDLSNIISEPLVKTYNAQTCDAVSALKSAISFVENSSAEVITAAAVGCKPHAIGLSLLACAFDRVEFVCRVPATYRAIEVPATGRVFKYDIWDRFEPGCYRRTPRVQMTDKDATKSADPQAESSAA